MSVNLTLRQFKALVKQYGGTYDEQGSTKTEHRAWWDAYSARDNLYILLGRLVERTGGDGSVYTIVNWLHWEPKKGKKA